LPSRPEILFKMDVDQAFRSAPLRHALSESGIQQRHDLRFDLPSAQVRLDLEIAFADQPALELGQRLALGRDLEGAFDYIRAGHRRVPYTVTPTEQLSQVSFA